MTSSESNLTFVGQPHRHSFVMSGITTERMTGMRLDESLTSEPFTAFDRLWQICVYLNGNSTETEGRIVAMLELLRSTKGPIVDVKFTVSKRPFDINISRFYSPSNHSGVGISVSVPTIKTREIAKKRRLMIPDATLTVDVCMRLVEQGERASTSVIPVPPSIILDRLRDIYEKRLHVPFDVVLVCEDGRFEAHSFVLVMRSKTLAAQLGQSFAQADACECGRPAIKEIRMQERMTKQTIERMLEFMYTDDMSLDCVEEASHLLYAADFYQIDRLCEICQNTIANNLTVENAAEMLTTSDFHSANALKVAILKFIVRNIAPISRTPGYLYMARTRPELSAELMHLVATGAMPSEAVL